MSLLSTLRSATRTSRLGFQSSLGADVVVLQGGSALGRNGDVEHRFRQHSDVLYLTGCHLEGLRLILSREECHLFLPEIDSLHKVWLGDQPTLEEISEDLGIEHLHPMAEFDSTLKRMGGMAAKLLISSSLMPLARRLCPMTPSRAWKLDADLAPFRVTKNEDEIALMRHVGEISSGAHRHVMQHSRPGESEWQVRDRFRAHLLSHGVRELAFPSISAAQDHGAVLHYTRHDGQLKEGDLFLLDAGGEHLGYAADITRTWPIASTFSPIQKDVYQVVLQAQKDITELAGPGVWMSDLQEKAMRTMGQGLLDLGLLRGSADDLFEKKSLSLFYPHGCSHMLGLDVHDVSPPASKPGETKVRLRSEQELQPGMVITNEPGLYFIPALLEDPEKREEHKDFLDLKRIPDLLSFGGIRIEDDLLITDAGCESLSSVEKEVQDIEALRKEALS